MVPALPGFPLTSGERVVKQISRSKERVKLKGPFVQSPPLVSGEPNTNIVKLAGLRKAALLTCIVGPMHAVLFIASMLILISGAGVQASNAEIITSNANDSSLC